MIDLYQRSDFYLQRLNPMVKLGCLAVVIFSMVLCTDPITPLIVAAAALAALRVLGGVPWRAIFPLLTPFLLFAAAFLWMSILFPAERGGTLLLRMGPLLVTWENVWNGLSLGMRSLVFGVWSLLFSLTTVPVKLMLGLVQHCKLPPRFGYGTMAAYRMIPLFRQELEHIRAAHRIRGLGEARGIKGKWEQWKRYAIPLLAQAIRKAERTAIAMESKGFDDSRDRTYYERIPWTMRDIAFGGGTILLLLAVFLLRQLWLS
ncbi:energy-coupling factor transporter transmembrane component T family protein [Paenibacillus alkalitolerans]|uniref:energy-coupling factor transporter transmembrane component T family protein n=1 Tax=Paenibacillus alkalitolerans TaxID=2799335 RepID=UPI0018F3B27D|nr:energy-coupling factor transporter transmembrane component T [Paenibacillus alkalitolerans]